MVFYHLYHTMYFGYSCHLLFHEPLHSKYQEFYIRHSLSYPQDLEERLVCSSQLSKYLWDEHVPPMVKFK